MSPFERIDIPPMTTMGPIFVCKFPGLSKLRSVHNRFGYYDWLDEQAARDRKSHPVKRLIANIVRALS